MRDQVSMLAAAAAAPRVGVIRVRGQCALQKKVACAARLHTPMQVETAAAADAEVAGQVLRRG